MTDGRLTKGIGGARSLATPSLAFEWCHAHRIGGGARFLATPFCLGLLAASGGGPVSGHSRGSVWAFQLKDDGTRIAEGQKRQKVGGTVFWPRPNLHAYTVWEGNQRRQRLRGPVSWPHLGKKKPFTFTTMRLPNFFSSGLCTRSEPKRSGFGVVPLTWVACGPPSMDEVMPWSLFARSPPSGKTDSC